MAHTNSYPSAAQVAADIAAEEIEIVTDGNAAFITEYNEELWSVTKQTSPARALGIYFPTALSANAIEGYYEWDGEIKKFTAGAAVVLTNNDTNYIWLIEAGTIATAVDGTGWPAVPHIKLAEVTIAGGVITTVLDRRQSIVKSGSTTASGLTKGMVACKVLASVQLKALLNNVTNNLFAVNAGDEILHMAFWTQTAGGACLVDCGPDATARAAGAVTDGILDGADANATGVFSSDDVAGTYSGAQQDFGTFVADADGYITILSAADISAGAFVGKIVMYYIPAQNYA